ncbi:MAG: hypothetical protein ACRDGE_04605, partial [Candidatus Limnocylindria bacterium]
VRARIEAPPVRRPWWGAPRLAFVPAAVTALVIALGVVAVQPGTLSAAAEALCLRGLCVFRGGPPTADFRAQIPGDRVASVAEASARAGFPVRMSTDGHPTEIVVNQIGTTTEVTLVFTGRIAGGPERPVYLVTQSRGEIEDALVAKVIGPGTRVERVQVNGRPGVWIEGAPHDFSYVDRDGRVITGTLRLAANVLAWDQDGILFRVEGQLSREEALRIASTLR